MPLARIILGGLNVVAAIAFMALAAMSYGARYHRTYNVFRYDLAIQGLPVDDAETDAEGQRSAAKLTPDTLKKLFPSGNPVSTQKAEVEARYAQLQADLGGLDDAARQKKLVEFLKPLVRTFSEREALSTLKSEELQVLLDQEFEGGRTGKGPDGKELNLDQRRQAIARVLFNLAGPDDSAQQRVVTVVGLASYVREADRQTTALQDLALNQQKALATDQALFEI